MKDEVHCYKRILRSVLKRIRNSNIPEESKKNILDFYRECILRGYSKARTIKYLDTLERTARLLGKPFEEAKKEDIQDLIAEIEQRDYSEWTKHDYKVILRVFYRWLRDCDYPEETSWIKINKKTDHKLPEELLTVEEVNKLVDSAEHIRDKAFVQTLYESGCRIGELLALQIKHVKFDNFGAVLLVSGKTGQRRVRVVASAQKLHQWVENHPLKSDPNAPLWVTIGTNSRNKVWNYGTAREVLKRLVEKAGIKKRVYPHLFRHTRATHLANHLTEAQMKQYFGWVQGSRMASVYVHLSGRDVDKALLKLNGIKVEDDEKEPEFKPKVCPRCEARNSPDAKFCSKCGMCLDESMAVRVDELKLKAEKLVTELVKNPKVLNALVEGIERLRGNEQIDLTLNEQKLNDGGSGGSRRIQERKDGGSASDN